jgi:hypothetical protein
MAQPTFREFYAAWTAYQEFLKTTETQQAQKRNASRKKKRRQDTARAGRPWSEREKQDVVTDYKAGMTMLGLARKYGRSQKAINDRLWHVQYGLLRREPAPAWQDEVLQ